MLLRQALWKAGLRYRLHLPTPVGRPDIVFPGRKVAIFIDGCFWHGCPEHYVWPRSRNEFWAAKLLANFERDHRQTRDLEALGWQVLRFWEHEAHVNTNVLVHRVRAALEGRGTDEPLMHVVQVESLNQEGSLERRTLRDVRHPERTVVIERARSTRKW